MRIFADEGEAMRVLIEALSRDQRPVLSGYAARLLAAFPQPGTASKPGLTEPEGQPAKTMLLEPLSERELEVLRLLRSELSGPEIARS